MNYFQFYDLPVRFSLDTDQLKQLFLAKSRQYHPDFFTLASPQQQDEALHLTTLNNQAYQTLSQPLGRIKYLLELHQLIDENEKYTLPPDFLMQMMELNEALADLPPNATPAQQQTLQQHIHQLQQATNAELNTYIQQYEAEKEEQKQKNILLKIKKCYYKINYLLRTTKNQRNFATL